MTEEKREKAAKLLDKILDMIEDKPDAEPCEDCISRADLINLLIPKIKTRRSTIEIKDKLIPLIKSLNPIQPKPKTGHWIDHQEGRWIYAMCSECETVHDTRTNYCPNCGAKMESEDK